MISSAGDIYLIAGQRAIMAYVHASGGGPVELHACMFGMTNGEFTSALYRLKNNNRLRRVDKGVWEEVRDVKALRARRS